jgi:beta-lactamase regulating signal transducer with metallopeptidase domain
VIVLLKFVTPPVVTWPWAVPDPLGVASLDARVNPAARVDGRAADWFRNPPAAAPAAAAGVARRTGPADTASRDGAVSGATAPSAWVWPWLAVVWASGSFVLIGIEGARLVRLHRRIRAARPAEPVLVERVAALSTRLGIEPPRVCEIDALRAPLVWCVGRPVLLWPAGLAADGSGASDACVDGLLVHELAHIKRRDHFVGWIELTAGIVWWWNPLYWYVRAARREQAELACDAWVIDALPHGRRAYAESLLALAIGPAGPSPLTVLAVRAGTRRALERRLVMIMKGRAAVRLPVVGLFALLFLVAATFPAWATAPGQVVAVQTPPPPPVRITVKPTDQQLLDEMVRVIAEVQAVVTQTAQPKPKPQPKTVHVRPPLEHLVAVKLADVPDLPAGGQDLIKVFEADRAAIMAEADAKVVARRDVLAKALADLQEEYTKAGKLDEAVAIRDYIRAGLPGLDRPRLVIREKGK